MIPTQGGYTWYVEVKDISSTESWYINTHNVLQSLDNILGCREIIIKEIPQQEISC